MAEFPAMPLWTDAYLADTTHLTTLEHGAYLLLLMAMWRNGGWLPNDERRLARFAHLPVAQWLRHRDALMPFFKIANGRIVQGRLEDEFTLVKRKRESQAIKANAKWLKKRHSADAAASSGHMPTLNPKEESLSPSTDSEPQSPEETPPASPPVVVFQDLDAIFYQRGKALLGPKAGGQLTKLRAAVGLGQALQIIDDAQRKDSPAEYVAGCIRRKGNGFDRYRRPSAVQELARNHFWEKDGPADGGFDQSLLEDGTTGRGRDGPSCEDGAVFDGPQKMAARSRS